MSSKEDNQSFLPNVKTNITGNHILKIVNSPIAWYAVSAIVFLGIGYLYVDYQKAKLMQPTAPLYDSPASIQQDPAKPELLHSKPE